MKVTGFIRGCACSFAAGWTLIAAGPARAQCTSVPMATLGASDPQLNDYAGMSLTTNATGTRVVFGTGGHSHVGYGRGSSWIVNIQSAQTTKPFELMPAVGIDNLGFAASLAMNAVGDMIVAGAPVGQPSPAVPRIYIFRFNGTNWVEETSILSSWGGDDNFGQSVALSGSGDLIAVGAPGRYFTYQTNFPGAVDMYRKDPSGWVLEKSVILPFNSWHLGWRVALSADGNLLAAGSATWINGEILLFQRDGGAWNHVASLHETVAHSSGAYGRGLAVDATGQTVVVGSPNDWVMGYLTGAAFVFRKQASGWLLDAEMRLPSQGLVDQMGTSVTISASGDSVFVGVPGRSYGGIWPNAMQPGAGAVFEYERGQAGWQQVGDYPSPSNQKWAGFGSAVVAGVTGRRWVVAEAYADTVQPDAGLVHIFESPCTTPTVYCTAKMNSLGCVPHIGWQGTPSASSPNGFTVSIANTRNQMNGLLFYGTNGSNAVPWLGGTLCVHAPLHRTPLQNAGGTPLPASDCSGTFAFDFNTWTASGVDTALFAGQHVRAQYFSRDPGASAQVSITDAIDFYLEP